MNFEDFILFDAFKKTNKLYLNLSVYDNYVNHQELEVCINNKILTISNTIINTHKQCPVAIYVYNCDLIEHNLNYSVKYKNITHTDILQEVNIKNKYKLSLTTLFKDDYNLFPLFYDYYKKQGVEQFYMYYNGNLNDINILNILNKEDVVLISWNFPYRYNKIKHFRKSNKKKLPGWTTIAQFGQMHNALYKYGKDTSEYMIFCDIDEYLHIDNKPLKSFVLENKKDIYGFNNIWAKTIENQNNLSILPNAFLISENKYKYGHRSKNIYKTDKINTIGIHKIFEETDHLSKIINLKLFHFYNWTNKSSRNEIIECTNLVKI